MKQYLQLLQHILDYGVKSDDRTGTGTLSVFGTQARFNLCNEFPIVTTKKVIFSSVVKELLWMLRGETNINTLGCNIWNEWADKNGDLGPVYGAQWRSWPNYTPDDNTVLYKPIIDQITDIIESIKHNQHSRRHIVNAWNVAQLDKMALVPCHVMFQFYVRNNELSCQMYQRSCDMMLGGPFNIASYALLTYMIANECGLRPKEFIWTIGDAHIYLNHIDGAKEQLTREPLQLPQLILPEGKPVLEIEEQDIMLIGYKSHPRIKLPIAV